MGVDLRFLETEIAEGETATLRITLSEPLNIPDELPGDYVFSLSAGDFGGRRHHIGGHALTVEDDREVFDQVEIGFGFRSL